MNAVVGNSDVEFGLGSADGTPACHREPLCPLFEPVPDMAQGAEWAFEMPIRSRRRRAPPRYREPRFPVWSRHHASPKV